MEQETFNSLELAEVVALAKNRIEIKLFCPIARAACLSGWVRSIVDTIDEFPCVCWEKAKVISVEFKAKDTGRSAYGAFNNEKHEATKWAVTKPLCNNAMFIETEIYTQN